MKYHFAKGSLKGFSLKGSLQYTGERNGVQPGWNAMEGNKFLTAYSLYDAAISYQTEKFSIGFNIYNIANIKYATNGWWCPEYREWMFETGTPCNFRLQTLIKF
ncbi:TonB-dependent receptor [Emticicia sp. BO119]|uniref:TonB-dependent receptor n=1 Tax=Emticicia sp. BO119 TaxID=2757768 RepID=UPI0015EFE0E0|nr:TonB-dependent receptor [Emticicia sp. BO119]MBA4852981.1 TonB-dependent receptor [Emticicia sp. BO119]